MDRHHIIPRGHIGGRGAENWRLNLIDLQHDTHMNGHGAGWDYDDLWERMQYWWGELILLDALRALPEARHHPLVIRRADWAREHLSPAEREWADAMIAWARLRPSVIGVWAGMIERARPLPGWIKSALAGKP